MNAKQRRKERRYANKDYWERVAETAAYYERAYFERGVSRAPDWTDETGHTHTGAVTYRIPQP